MKINQIILILIFIFKISLISAQTGKIKLLVRADDIGSFHSANIACIDAYASGIARSVEVMVPCPWFPEAAAMLKEHPGYDVGVHLTLTSEWENYKWRPLTYAPGLVDENGYFFPMVWPNDNFPEGSSLSETDWKLEEIEKEFRAQIETALRSIPHVSHLSTHMGCSSIDERVDSLVENLAEEYGLLYVSNIKTLKRFRAYHTRDNVSKMTDEFIEALSKLDEGTYILVDHPAYNTPEMESIGHKGYYDVGANRDAVTKVFTNPRLMDYINQNNIELISYKHISEKIKAK